VVESKFGYHVILVYDRQDAGTRTLEEVRDDIAKKIATDEARDKAFDSAAGDALTIREGTSFETLAAERDIEIQTTSPVSRGNTIPGIGPANALIDAVLVLTGPEDVADPVRIGDTYYVAGIEERVDSYVPELVEIREKVEIAYRKEQAAELARDRADALLAEIKAGASLTAVAEAAGLEAEETREFNRRGGFVPGVGNLPGVKQIVFSGLGEGEPLPRTFTNRGDAYVFVLKSRAAADPEEFEQVKEDRIAALRSRKEAAAVGEFVRELKEAAKISYNNELIDSVLKQR
jgi:peptidyl-prolyl cis-trans isomerase D